MNWGKSIFLFYSLFVIALLSVVYFAFTQDVNLVADDYYKQEIAYENQINRIKNTNALAIKPEMHVVNGFVELSFPANINPKGYILFFHPEKSALDKKVGLALGQDHKQQIDFHEQVKGKWIAKLHWRFEGKEYYQEFTIVK